MRRHDWVGRMWAEVERAQARRFEWGHQDCCKFAASVVDAMTDSEFRRELDAAYHDKASALRFHVEQGGIAAACTARFGEPVPWAQARRGDLALMPTEDGVGSLGVIVGHAVACVREDYGLNFLPVSTGVAFWRVR